MRLERVTRVGSRYTRVQTTMAVLLISIGMFPYWAKPDGNGIERNSVLKFMQCRTTIRVECLFRTERKRYGRIR